MALSYMDPPLQNPREFACFLDILRKEGVKSYLEIGSMYGASLWAVANALPRRSRIVSIDPMSDRPEARSSLERCLSELRSLDYDAHFICGDSADPEVVTKAAHIGPFDAMLIDGNHSPGYVLSDWKNYGPMCRIVAFHDINWNSTWVSARGNTPDETLMGAPKIWNEIKDGYRHEEFRYHPEGNYHGIGVLWR